MDLGFTFTKEHLNPTMIRVVPGLLRLGFEQEKKRVVVRPYLSEAWLIKRPDSPLLNLRPRVYAAADMKKHLMFWARIVASVVRQES
ncbi:putative Peroxidase 21 precursor [Hibiscus syriacus]|uniref:Peroxidase 21 n=2 Tax=Hibiscus syriacus TaxID=106335 RepID=A0A6A3BIZ0_HIBSY|nr:putative Peroxidase 21 precursor [Hibiscus syriacus]